MRVPASPDGLYHYFIGVMYSGQCMTGVANMGITTEFPVLAAGITEIAAIVKEKLRRDDAIITAVTLLAAPISEQFPAATKPAPAKEPR